MFGRGLTIFRFRGIPIQLDWTLLLFLPYAAFIGAYQFRRIAESLDLSPAAIGLPPIAWGAILAVGLFVSVLLHELAHAIVTIRGGGHVKAIVLMMFGGVTLMDREVRPEREAWMAFVGPLSSFVIAAVSWAVAAFVPLPPGAMAALLVFAAMNALLGAFNLLPAFPMDGGRVLRGILATRIGTVRATRIAATVGQAMAVAFAIFALLSFNFILLFIAWFVWSGAAMEKTRLETRDVLQGIPVELFMTDRLGEAQFDEPSGEVARRLLQNNLVGVRVMDRSETEGGSRRTLGIVTAWDLADQIAEGPVREALRGDLPTVHSEDDAATALEAAGSGERGVVVVDQANEVRGLVTFDDLKRAVLLGAIAARGTR